MKTSISIIAIMLLYSVFAGFKDSLGNTAHAETLNIVITLAITCTLVVPIANLITLAAGAIVNAANFMLILVPVMAVLMISAGRAMSGGSYYTMMMAVCQGVSQLAAKVITPMLNIFLGLSVVSAAAPAVNIGGLTNRLGKIIKWCICFLMTIFTGVLSLKSMITGSADSVSSRVAKFSISSFVPLVGSSLSEAYQTVQGGVALVKSGLGVVSIFSVAIMFLPVIIQCVIFLVTINLTKGIGDVLNFGEPLKLLDAVCTVLSTLLAIIFAIAAVFIISTAITVMAGGGTQ
jgi:stage III sporulation protein AE